MTGFLPGHRVSYRISFLQLARCLSYGRTMKINRRLDQPSKKYAGFLISHIQLLSALLAIFSIGSVCGGNPAAEHPWLPFQPVLPGIAERAECCGNTQARIIFARKGSFDFELTVNRWGSFRTG